MADFSTILNHPDKEEILSKLFTGTSAKQISQWLKQKYPEPDQNHLHLTIKILTDFGKSDYTDYYTQVSKDLATVKSGGKLDKKIADSLLNDKTYQERINEIADSKLDLAKLMAESIMIMRARAIQTFDRIQENPRSVGKADYALIKWFETLFNAFEKYDKHVNQAPDQIVQHNITIQAVEEHTALFQECIRKTLSQIDPEASMLFMEIFTTEIQKLRPPKKPNEKSLQDSLQEAKLLQEKIIGD